MKKLLGIVSLIILIMNFGCVAIDKYVKGSKEEKLDEKTVIAGLKEALEVGIKKAVELVSQKNGYLDNAQIRIPLPPDLEDVADTVRQVGLGKQVDEFIESMNHAAEEAAVKAIDIFVDAITKMTFEDAWKILNGADNEATLYFEKHTREELYKIFRPVIKKAMDAVGVTALYKLIMDAYHALPFTPEKRFDLDDYVTNLALDGLFYMLAQEEKKIRKDPAARITDLLKKVFG